MRMPARGLPRSSGGALATPMSTVGAAQNIVIPSAAMCSKMVRGSTLRRQTWVAPTAVTIQTNVHPLGRENRGGPGGPLVRGSTLRRQTWVAPTAVTIQTNVHPLAWNIGRVQRYRSPASIGWCARVLSTLSAAFRWVIITPLGRDVVPLV